MHSADVQEHATTEEERKDATNKAHQAQLAMNNHKAEAQVARKHAIVEEEKRKDEHVAVSTST